MGFASSAAPSALLNEAEQVIYQKTFAVCKPGTIRSAVSLGFNTRDFAQSLGNLLQISAAQLQASENRMNSRGLSPNIHRLRNSDGFWLAMTDCYGYRYGKLNYGLLMKQIVDAGQLTTEVAAAGTVIAATVTGAQYSTVIWRKFPVLGRFLFSSMISLQVGQTLNLLRPLVFEQSSKEDRKDTEQVKSLVFEEPDKVIAEALKLATDRVAEIKATLESDGLTELQRTELTNRLASILQAIEKLKALAD